MKKCIALLLSFVLLFSLLTFPAAADDAEVTKGYNAYKKYKPLIDALESGNINKAQTEFNTLISSIKAASSTKDGYTEIAEGIYIKMEQSTPITMTARSGGQVYSKLIVEDVDVSAFTGNRGATIYIDMKGNFPGPNLKNYYWQLFDPEGYLVDEAHFSFGSPEKGTKFRNKKVSFDKVQKGYYTLKLAQ